MIVRILMLVYFISPVLSSCSKNAATLSSETKDTVPPTITIVSPTNNQQFTAGQIIQVTANASDNVKLTQLHIHITDKVTGNVLRDVHSYPGEKTGTVQDSFTATVGITYTIKIIAFDPSQSLGTAQVDVSGN